ncbi:MAG: LLM class flavin-dependent oxidoreductase, partial [Planctomycetota bacterium]
EAVEFEDVSGRTVNAHSLPRPLQSELPIWITCQSTESFVEAGRIGANVLTSLLGGTLEQSAEQIAKYRESLAANGHDLTTGTVSLMLHTFLGTDHAQVKEDIQQPFGDYLKTHYGLLENLAKGMGLEVSMDDFSEDDLDAILEFGVQGFMNDRSLIGTVEGCVPFVERVAAAGVDELCCLVDFVQDTDQILGALPLVKQLMDKTASFGATAC